MILGKTIVEFTLKETGTENIEYNHTTSGTYGTVHYILKMPSGHTFEMSAYTRNPDFICYRNTEEGRGDLGV